MKGKNERIIYNRSLLMNHDALKSLSDCSGQLSNMLEKINLFATSIENLKDFNSCAKEEIKQLKAERKAIVCRMAKLQNNSFEISHEI